MTNQPVGRARFELVYRGRGPRTWSGGETAFGLQDRAERLHLGERWADGAIAFHFSLEVKFDPAGAPVFLGSFAHGPPKARFLYLSWREPTGAYAQRFKLPLSAITAQEARAAVDADRAFVGALADWEPKTTASGANIGGARPIVWSLSGARRSEIGE